MQTLRHDNCSVQTTILYVMCNHGTFGTRLEEMLDQSNQAKLPKLEALRKPISCSVGVIKMNLFK